MASAPRPVDNDMNVDEKTLIRELLKHVDPQCMGGCETPATRVATCDCSSTGISFWCDTCTVPLTQFNQTKWEELRHAKTIREVKKLLTK